jgi:hypothetical protein
MATALLDGFTQARGTGFGLGPDPEGARRAVSRQSVRWWTRSNSGDEIDRAPLTNEVSATRIDGLGALRTSAVAVRVVSKTGLMVRIYAATIGTPSVPSDTRLGRMTQSARSESSRVRR